MSDEEGRAVYTLSISGSYSNWRAYMNEIQELVSETKYLKESFKRRRQTPHFSAVEAGIREVLRLKQDAVLPLDKTRPSQ